MNELKHFHVPFPTPTFSFCFVAFLKYTDCSLFLDQRPATVSQLDFRYHQGSTDNHVLHLDQMLRRCFYIAIFLMNGHLSAFGSASSSGSRSDRHAVFTIFIQNKAWWRQSHLKQGGNLAFLPPFVFSLRSPDILRVRLLWLRNNTMQTPEKNNPFHPSTPRTSLFQSFCSFIPSYLLEMARYIPSKPSWSFPLASKVLLISDGKNCLIF